MAKKKSSNGMFYLFGMALVVIGFFLPMFKAGPLEPNGWDFLNFKEFGFVTIGGLLILIGAVLGSGFPVSQACNQNYKFGGVIYHKRFVTERMYYYGTNFKSGRAVSSADFGC